ncbi:MAG: hypothetical protein ACYS30_21850 [Planctomycetota bacterium]
MAENGQQSDTTTRSTWKHKLKTVAQVWDVLFTSALVLVFIAVLLTGYLSWIGIAVGAVFLASMIATSALLLTGDKRLEKRSGQLFIGTMITIVVAAAAVQFWPEGDDTWRPYQFEDELAAMEAKRAVPDENNAAIYYESVFAEKDVNDWPNSFLRKDGNARSEFTNYPWKSTDYPKVSQWLDSHSDTIDELLRIGRMEKCRWPIQADFYDNDTFPYYKLRRSAELLIAAGMRDLGQGRLHKALEKCFCVLRMAEHMYQQTQIVHFICGMACESTALEPIRYTLVQSNVPQQDAERIAEHLLSPADPWLQDWSIILESEKLQYMNLLARVYEVNDKGDVRFAAGYALSNEDGQTHEIRGRKYRWFRLYHLMNMPLNPKAVRGMADRYFARFDYLLRPHCTWQTGVDQESSFWSPGSLIKLLCNCYRWGIETIIFDGEGYIGPRHLHTILAARRRGTWLVLGLRKYRNSHGQWPEELDLISEYIPSEAFTDPTNGDKFIYIRDDDNFTLYSKGFNGVDEAGRGRYGINSTEEGDDIAIWPLTERKTGGADDD